MRMFAVSTEELNDVAIEFVRFEVLGVQENDEVVLANVPNDVALSNELHPRNSTGIVPLSSCTAIQIISERTACTGFKKVTLEYLQCSDSYLVRLTFLAGGCFIDSSNERFLLGGY